MICPYCGKFVPKEIIQDHYNLSCPFPPGSPVNIVLSSPIHDVYSKYEHLDKRIERLPRSQFVNVVLGDLWNAVKDHIGENCQDAEKTSRMGGRT